MILKKRTVNTNVSRSSFVWFRYMMFNANYHNFIGWESGVPRENNRTTVSQWQIL